MSRYTRVEISASEDCAFDWNRAAVDHILANWLRPGGGFRFSPEADSATLLGTSTAILTLQYLGALDRMPAEHRVFCREWISDAQRTDGTYADSPDESEPTHAQPEWAFQLHRARHNAWALQAMGEEPSFPSAFVLSLTSSGKGVDFVAQLLESEIEGGIWNLGNWVMDILVQLDLADRCFSADRARQTYHDILDFFETRVDERSGYWLMLGDDLRCGMAGSMHFYPAYWSVGRPAPLLRQSALSTIALQQADGLFAYHNGQGGEQCLDLDAAYILRNARAAHPDLRPEVDPALARLGAAQMQNLLPSGAWRDNTLPQMRYWGSRALAYRSDSGSLWDTYARLLTAGMCLPTGADSAFFPEHHWFEIFDAGRGWRNGIAPVIPSSTIDSNKNSELSDSSR